MHVQYILKQITTFTINTRVIRQIELLAEQKLWQKNAELQRNEFSLQLCSGCGSVLILKSDT